MSSRDDDLLRPTLAPGLDVRTFQRPWNPAHLMWAAFFGLIFGGGFLFAENARRLGREEERKRILLGALVVGIVASIAAGFLFARAFDHDASERRGDIRIVRFGFVAAALLLAGWLKNRQMPLFEAYDNAGRKSGSLWLWALAAALIGWALHVALTLATVYFVRGKLG